MNFLKKSQFMVISGLFLFMIIYFIYSIETDNTYISKNGNFILLEKYPQELCLPIQNKTGITLNQSINTLENRFTNYCNGIDYNCSINIYNITTAPPEGNISKLNMSQYRISITFEDFDYNYSEDFSC